MDKHHGEIIERLVRRNNVSITDLARQSKVSRSKVYEWFNKAELGVDVIYKIGRVLKYDFSKDFPEYFPNKYQSSYYMQQSQYLNNAQRVDIWKDKYIVLLEKYKELLSQ